MPAAIPIAAAVAGAVVSSALADDYGAEAANTGQSQALAAKTALDAKRYAFWEQYYQPLEIQLSKEAQTYGSEQRQGEAAAEVGSSLTQGYDAADAQLRRNLEASGNNPSDPAFISAQASQALARGAGIGGAQYQARKGVRDDAFAKQYGVAQLGRDIPGSVSGGLATSANLYGQQALQGTTLQRQQQQDIAYGLQPVMKGVTNAAQNWWSSPGAGAVPANGVTFNPSQTGWNSAWGDIGLAEGAVVEKPTRAVIAEDGNPEAVLNAGALKLLGEKNVERLNHLGNLIRKGVSRTREPQRPMVSIRGVAYG